MKKLLLPLLAAVPMLAAGENQTTVDVTFHRFSEVDRDAQMWSGMHAGSNGKIYCGACTHGDAANLYEFDPATQKMRLLSNITILNRERGYGIWSNGKIHVQMQEVDGWMYFGTLSEDNGPPGIDPRSYKGPRWFRAELATGNVEPLGYINTFWGLLGQDTDVRRRLIYGLAEDGRLYKYRIDDDVTEDLGRVDNWDICRTIFVDHKGNVHGSRAPGRLWVYEVETDRLIDKEFLELPVVNVSRTMANPMLDRKAQWRIIEWDPVDKAAYGIVGGTNMLFRYDPYAGREGEIVELAVMCAPEFRDGDPFLIPHASLAMAISQKERKIYYITVMAGDFDYGAVAGDRVASAYLMSYDLKSGKREDHGVLKTKDGRRCFGMQGMQIDAEGRVWFMGAFEEPDPKLAAGRLLDQVDYALGLGLYDPFEKSSDTP
jgi:hypothetical protein